MTVESVCHAEHTLNGHASLDSLLPPTISFTKVKREAHRSFLVLFSCESFDFMGSEPDVKAQ